MGTPLYLVSDSLKPIVPIGQGVIGAVAHPYPRDLRGGQWLAVVMKLLAMSTAGVRVVDLNEMSLLGPGGYLAVLRDEEAAAFASDPEPGERFESWTDFLRRS